MASMSLPKHPLDIGMGFYGSNCREAAAEETVALLLPIAELYERRVRKK